MQTTRKKKMKTEYKTIKATELKVGDTVTLDVGYTVCDDQDCRILSITPCAGVFGNEVLNIQVREPGGSEFGVQFNPRHNVTVAVYTK